MHKRKHTHTQSLAHSYTHKRAHKDEQDSHTHAHRAIRAIELRANGHRVTQWLWADFTRDKWAMPHGTMAEGGRVVGLRAKGPMAEGSRAGGLRA